MKTTVELPDELLRRAKATAAHAGISLKELLTDALRRRLDEGPVVEQPWCGLAGELNDLRRESRRIDKLIEEEFEQVDEEHVE